MADQLSAIAFLSHFKGVASGFFLSMIPDAFYFLKIEPVHRDCSPSCIPDAFFAALQNFLHRDCCTIFIPMLDTRK